MDQLKYFIKEPRIIDIYVKTRELILDFCNETDELYNSIYSEDQKIFGQNVSKRDSHLKKILFQMKATKSNTKVSTLFNISTLIIAFIETARSLFLGFMK